MKKSKVVVIQFLFFLTLLFTNTLVVKAVTTPIDYGGTPIESTGGKSGGGCIDGKLCLQMATAVKVNLVKINPDDGNIKVVNYYYIVGPDNAANFKNNSYYFTSNSHDANLSGLQKAYGHINDNGTYSDEAPASQDAVFQWNLFGDDKWKHEYFFANNEWGFNFNATKAANTLSNKSDEFFKVINKALYGTNIISYDGDWNSLKELFNKADNRVEEAINEVAKLADYKIILEPIYRFQTDACLTSGIDSKDCEYAHATIKAIANRTDLIGFNYGLETNCFASLTYGKINENGLVDATTKNVANVYSGYGYLVVSITEQGSPTKPKLPTCKVGTGKNGGTEPYKNYYMMISSADTSHNGKKLTYNYRDSNTFTKLINELNNNASSGFSYSLNNIEILADENPIEDLSNDSKRKTFVDNYTKAFAEPGSSFEQNGDYYVALTDDDKYSSFDTEKVRYNSKFPSTTLLNGSLSGDVYSYTIQRDVPDSMDTNGTFYPTMYRLSYCISKEEKKDCDPETNKAVCTSDDSGTKAKFHENEKLKTCTLNDTTESGFKIYNLKDTKNSFNDKSYCEVACKDDFDLELPTSKLAAAGQYFVLNNFTPKISIKRTCVTTKVNYDEFEADLERAKKEMIDAYNTWQDYKEYATVSTLGAAKNPESNGSGSGSPSTSCCDNSCGGSTPTCCDSGGSCSYSWTGWKTDYTAKANGTHFSETGCDGTIGCSPCGGTSTYCTYTKSQLVTHATSEADDRYDEYIVAKDKYNDLIGKFEMCSNWVENKTIDYETDSKAKLNMTFQYNDKDGAVFGSSGTYGRKYAYEYKKTDVTPEENKEPKVTYWQKGENTSETYSTGGDDSKDTKEISIVNCDNVGLTCTTSNSTEKTFVTSSYIKRIENITYTYHLEPLSTLTPSGRIIQTDEKNGRNAIDLEADAVPININTPAGTSNYVLTLTGIRDKVRLDSENKKSVKDSFAKKFLGNVLTGQEKTGTSSSNDIATYTCNYEVKNDMIKEGDLNFFYRTIDMNNPFPNTREIGYNWTSEKAKKVINNMKIESNNYQTLINGEKFSFTMTPVIMQQIRSYNGKKEGSIRNTYSDWDLRCDDYDKNGQKYHCYSTFLTCLASGSKTSTPGAMVPGGCNSIFGDSLSRYHTITNYDLTDLNNNRDLLIKKQDILDGRGG